MIKTFENFKREEYGNRFIPYDIFEKLWSLGSFYEYMRTMKELMIGKYVKFSNIKKTNLLTLTKKTGLIEGYVESLNFALDKPNFSVKIKNEKTYVLDALGEVRVYDFKPEFISSDSDPYGEEDWDD